MEVSKAQDLRYPIGRFEYRATADKAALRAQIETISQLPDLMRKGVEALSREQLAWKYRPEGWNIKQVVHHCADSHMNCLIRFKLTLTEDAPTIRPYHEDRWAELPVSNLDDLRYSLDLLRGIHFQLTYIMNSLDEEDLKRVYVHPEHGRRYALDEAIALYAWHGKHHLAHIHQALDHVGKWG